jgi:hypothetical protein
MAVGGDLIDVNWTHPTLGQGTFYFKSGEDSSLMIGGFISSDEDGNIDGSGTRIDQLNRTVPYIKGTAVNDMSIGTAEQVQALAANIAPATYTFTWLNGHVYKITGGKIVGAVEINVNASTFDLKIAGSNTAQKLT